MSLKLTGIKVGKTDITSTYVDSTSQSDVQELTVTAVSLDSMSNITDNFVYNGSEIRPDPIVYAMINGTKTELHRQNGDYTLSYLYNINAGTATVTATGSGNFTGSVSQNFTIHPKEASLQWGDVSWTYDGSEHSTTCIVSNLVGSDTCTVTLTGNSITNIGTTTVTATSLSNPNYSLPNDVTMTLTILAGMFIKVSGTWTPVKKAYKKVSGSWVLQELGSVFDTNKRYIKGN